ncbi:hypothetical protein M2360_000468 [Rhizobium sp. SG_E_25_P2]|uniref:hypothetical protein n=1 Tax=Rhizobium sp. SG_E_25_P2 TaxID=2879942 RepID=UPI0024753637|nr:hypothetical protein [Rhizobium sp. SG_E_25_P2]MDH6265087.1 hypothetical protein [Rhizobium sp. SG_E_25_P2]
MRALHWRSEMKQSCSYCIYLTHLLCHEIYFRFSGRIDGHAAETGSGSRSPSGRPASQDYTSKQQSPGLFSVDKTRGRQVPIFKFRLNRKIGCTTPADGRQFDRAVLKPICSNTSATPTFPVDRLQHPNRINHLNAAAFWMNWNCHISMHHLHSQDSLVWLA